MKHLLLAILLLLAMTTRAQTSTTPISAPAYRYCAIIVDDRYFSNANVITLDYGYRRNNGIRQADATLDEAQMLFRKNQNVIFALNYLADLGWECFDVTNVPSEKTASGYITSETRYLFRRPR
jgi:hypothetical protein